MRRVKGPGWWIVTVTVVEGPDDSHPLIIRLTLSTHDRREARVVASSPEACDQLTQWLEEVTTEVRR
jgi:hypothetical protein